MNIAKINGLFLKLVAISGAFSVLFGAWLAHSAGAMSVDDVARLKSAHHYQVIHTLAMLAVCLFNMYKPAKLLLLTISCYFIGILLFSGLIYLKVLIGFSALSMLTPMGGISFALGWLTLLFVGSEKE